MSTNKPAFDPSQPFEAVKPKFDPNAPFEAAAGEDEGIADATLRGGAQGFSGGFADEAYGVVGALVNPTNSDKDFGDRYRDSRDYARRKDKSAEENHGKVYTGSNVVGAIGTGILTGGAGNTLKGSAAFGAANGLGASDADLTDPTLENVGQAALDTVKGAAVGAAGYGAGKAIEKGVGAVAKAPGAVKDGWEYIKGLGAGARRGAKEAGEDLPSVVKPFAEIVGGVKGAVSELKELNSTAKEFSAIAKEARDHLANQVKAGGMKIRPLQEIQSIGNGKSVAGFTDDEAVLAALMSEGDNPVKRWAAEKAATLQPGQIDVDEYSKALGLSSEARNAAHAFDPREAAKSLAPVVEDVQSLFRGARNARFNELQTAAKGTFDSHGATSVLDELDGAIADANRLNSIPAKTSATLADVHVMLNDGVGIKSQKLTPGAWADVDPVERFQRLQKARELIDGEIKWAGREGHGNAEGILRDVREQINAALKTSPEKVEGDALFKASKELEAKFFGATEFKNAAGGIEVDEGKIARLLGNTDAANRFRGAIDDMKQFAKREDLAPEFRDQAKKLISDLESHIGVADTKRSLGAMRYKNGPSSPAIERMGSVSRGNSLVQDAISAPAGAMNQIDQFDKVLKSRIGKSFDSLNPDEKAAAVKFRLWLSKHPDAGPDTVNTTFARLFKP